MSVLTQFFGSSGGGGGSSSSTIEARVQIVDGGSGASLLKYGICSCPNNTNSRRLRAGGAAGYVYDLHYNLTPGATCPIVTGVGGTNFAASADDPVPAPKSLCITCLSGCIYADFKMGEFGTRSSFGGTYITEEGLPFCLLNQCGGATPNPAPPYNNTIFPWACSYQPPTSSDPTLVTIFSCGEFVNIPYIPCNYKNKIPDNIYNYVPLDAGLYDWGNNYCTRGACFYCNFTPVSVPVGGQHVTPGCLCARIHFYYFNVAENLATESVPNTPTFIPTNTIYQVTKHGYCSCAAAYWLGARSPNFAKVTLSGVACCRNGFRLTEWNSDKWRKVNDYIKEAVNVKGCAKFECHFQDKIDRLEVGSERCGIENACLGAPSTCGSLSQYLDNPYCVNDITHTASPCCYGPTIGMRGKASWKGYVSDITGELREYGAGGRGIKGCTNSDTVPGAPCGEFCVQGAPTPLFCTPWNMFCGSGGGAPYHCVAPPSCPSTDAYGLVNGQMAYTGGSPGSVIIQYPDEYAAATVSSPNVCDCSPNTPGFRTYAFYQPGSITLP